MPATRSLEPEEPDVELRCLLYKVDNAWGNYVWFHARELETGKGLPLMLLLTGHEPYMYCEPEAPALDHRAVQDVEHGHVGVDGDDLVKLTLSHPGRTPKVRNLCENPHEADVPYVRRCIVDAQAWGVCTVKATKRKPGVYVTKPEWVTQESREPDVDLDVLYFDIEGGNPHRVEAAREEVICIGLRDPANDDWHLWSYHPLDDVEIDTVETKTHGEVPVEHRHFVDETDRYGDPVDGECKMLKSFIDWLYERNAEVLAGYNNAKFDVPYLIHRGRKLGIDDDRWGGHGKLDPHYTNVPGYQSLDIYKVHIAATYGGLAGGNTLEDVLEEFTGIEKAKDSDRVHEWWHEDPEALFRYNIQDVEATELIDQTQDYGEIAASSMFTSLTPGISDLKNVSKLYFSLMLEKGQERGVAMPPRFGEEEWDFSGGLVFEPANGIHERAASADWSSLYPTAIVTGNISYETHVPKDEVTGDEPWLYEVPDMENAELLEAPLYFDTREQGILPEIILDVWELKKEKGRQRTQAEEKAENRKADILYDMSKIILNGGFGIASGNKSPLSSVQVGEAITATSRAANRGTAKLIEETGREALYGDTDSVKFRISEDDTVDELLDLMSDVEVDIREEMAALGAREVERYELEMEHIYEPLLLTPAKKRYAYRLVWDEGTWLEEPERKVKGFWMVRSDCGAFTRYVQGEVFDRLLMEQIDPMEVHAWVAKLWNRIRLGEESTHRVAVRKPITKSLTAYTKTEDDGSTTWTYPYAKSCYEANRFFELDEHEKWRPGDRPFSMTLLDAPEGYDANQLPLRVDDEIPEGFKVDWTYHADLMVANKLTRIYQALGMEDLLDELAEQSLAQHGVSYEASEPEQAAATDGASSDATSQTTTQHSVSDFM